MSKKFQIIPREEGQTLYEQMGIFPNRFYDLVGIADRAVSKSKNVASAISEVAMFANSDHELAVLCYLVGRVAEKVSNLEPK